MGIDLLTIVDTHKKTRRLKNVYTYIYFYYNFAYKLTFIYYSNEVLIRRIKHKIL